MRAAFLLMPGAALFAPPRICRLASVADVVPWVRSRLVDDELEALQWLTVDELAAARRRAIKKLNLLDRSATDYSATEMALQRTLTLIGQVQDDRRRRR